MHARRFLYFTPFSPCARHEFADAEAHREQQLPAPASAPASAVLRLTCRLFMGGPHADV